MAKKNPFANLMDPSKQSAANPTPSRLPNYAPKGASRAMFESMAELHSAADRLTDGETIVELDTATLDESFLKDRIEDDPEEFGQLREAIRENGQHSPILVRPHPDRAGRYMIVFGHRRARAARELQRPVRAVVRDLKDIEHVIAQGQENSARANLSFIEKAMFAGALSQQRYDNQVIMAALSVTPPTLSVMQSVAKLPVDILDLLGGAKSVGRTRWYELKQLLERPSSLELAKELIVEPDKLGADPEARFDGLVKALKTIDRKPRKAADKSVWQAAGQSVAAELTTEERKYTILLKAKKGTEAADFGRYVSGRLDGLYEDFCKEKDETENGA